MRTLTANNPCQNSHYFAIARVEWGHILESQANQWRHKCAACAYDQGYRDAMADAAEAMARMFAREVQDLLPISED